MKTINYLLIITIFCGLQSCKKYLDKKSDKSLSLPTTIEDLQAVLDFNSVMNLQHPSIGESSSDNYFVTPASVNSLTPAQRNAYLWDTAAYGNFPNDWAKCYQPVYQANMVLSNIDNIDRTVSNAANWDNVKGAALFFRARGFLTALWNWAKAYDGATANSDLGVPLRLTDDFNQPSTRATVQESYNRVIEDLRKATMLLPDHPSHVMRPSKAAAFALLARTFLSMRVYDSCLVYAERCLSIKNNLIDYNELKASSTWPVPQFNAEVIFHGQMDVYANLQKGRIDTTLMDLYSTNDLRNVVFFKKEADGFYSFKGNYTGARYPFTGIATGEVWLMRAEAKARLGNTEDAVTDLNTLLEKRYKNGSFLPYRTTSKSQVLDLVLSERRKELLFRDLRWMDIKRLNKENAGITVQRVINSQSFVLESNANRFALPLPLDLVSISGMLQNPY